jgi:hypothetical protein
MQLVFGGNVPVLTGERLVVGRANSSNAGGSIAGSPGKGMVGLIRMKPCSEMRNQQLSTFQ